jgi:MtN3 and saliva related transmembrane protein
MEYLGYAAGVITTLSFLPQVIRVFRIKSAHDISILFNMFFLLGVIIWMVYGIILGLKPVIAANAAAAVLVTALLFGKLKYG